MFKTLAVAAATAALLTITPTATAHTSHKPQPTATVLDNLDDYTSYATDTPAPRSTIDLWSVTATKTRHNHSNGVRFTLHIDRLWTAKTANQSPFAQTFSITLPGNRWIRWSRTGPTRAFDDTNPIVCPYTDTTYNKAIDATSVFVPYRCFGRFHRAAAATGLSDTMTIYAIDNTDRMTW